MSTIVLDETKIATLANDPHVVAMFPFFGARVSKAACCGKAASVFPDFNTIRHCVVHMDEDKKLQFKKLLGADGIIVHHHDSQKVLEVYF